MNEKKGEQCNWTTPVVHQAEVLGLMQASNSVLANGRGVALCCSGRAVFWLLCACCERNGVRETDIRTAVQAERESVVE